jgi:hypothetical protein
LSPHIWPRREAVSSMHVPRLYVWYNARGTTGISLLSSKPVMNSFTYIPTVCPSHDSASILSYQ